MDGGQRDPRPGRVIDAVHISLVVGDGGTVRQPRKRTTCRPGADGLDDWKYLAERGAERPGGGNLERTGKGRSALDGDAAEPSARQVFQQATVQRECRPGLHVESA